MPAIGTLRCSEKPASEWLLWAVSVALSTIGFFSVAIRCFSLRFSVAPSLTAKTQEAPLGALTRYYCLEVLVAGGGNGQARTKNMIAVSV